MADISDWQPGRTRENKSDPYEDLSSFIDEIQTEEGKDIETVVEDFRETGKTVRQDNEISRHDEAAFVDCFNGGPVGRRQALLTGYSGSGSRNKGDYTKVLKVYEEKLVDEGKYGNLSQMIEDFDSLFMSDTFEKTSFNEKMNSRTGDDFDKLKKFFNNPGPEATLNREVFCGDPHLIYRLDEEVEGDTEDEGITSEYRLVSETINLQNLYSNGVIGKWRPGSRKVEGDVYISINERFL